MEVRTSGRADPEKGLQSARTIGTVSVFISLLTWAEIKGSLFISLPVFSICTECENDRRNPF
jgi:hypothetical protein